MTSEATPVVWRVRFIGYAVIKREYFGCTAAQAVRQFASATLPKIIGDANTVQVAGPHADCEWQTVTVTPELVWKISGMRGGE
jgi:hypothetical protein